MSLDIGDFLKAEIAKKKDEWTQERLILSRESQQEQQKPLQELRQAKSSQKERLQEPIPDEKSHQASVKQKETGTNGHVEVTRLRSTTLEYLQSRPDRLKLLLEQDKEINTMINPVHVTDAGKTRHIGMQCNLYIHQLLNQWVQHGYQPELLPETKKSFFPLLVRLRKNTLPQDLVISLATVLYHLQVNELHLATESYMKLSIGNVAWPIGVTSVGIHARSAQTRIQGDKGVANVMLDDQTRLWITSVKRLITFKEFLKE
ncbi:PRP18 (YGR006W) [Zygosaccharomyces parabailii]|nr:PRP18 (YGR006W) [Zygosaccharomyces parabailii]CDH09356.1 related to Pre-mRNA-splicing factor 18 [Zygosaccharomyces bailii ISA1307]SJM87702.1 related to Pre-mRNA-splicing factor 18 [Zygosaccharomyces bailii]